MYRFMLAGLSSNIISDLGPTVAQNSPVNVLLYVDGQCIDLAWLACLLPVSVILVSPTMPQNRPAKVPIYVGRPAFRRYF